MAETPREHCLLVLQKTKSGEFQKSVAAKQTKSVLECHGGGLENVAQLRVPSS